MKVMRKGAANEEVLEVLLKEAFELVNTQKLDVWNEHADRVAAFLIEAELALKSRELVEAGPDVGGLSIADIVGTYWGSPVSLAAIRLSRAKMEAMVLSIPSEEGSEALVQFSFELVEGVNAKHVNPALIWSGLTRWVEHLNQRSRGSTTFLPSQKRRLFIDYIDKALADRDSKPLDPESYAAKTLKESGYWAPHVPTWRELQMSGV